MAISVGSLQYVLEKGHDEDWFSSNLIVLFTTTAFYAQEIKKIEQKEMKQIKPTIVKAIPKNRVGTIDPLTQELIPPYNASPGNEITILFPPSNMQYPNSNDLQIQSFMLLQWKATSGHTVEIKTLRENIHGFYEVVQDWTPFVVDEPDGIKDEKIPFSGSPVGHSLIVKILIRDTADRSQVKTIFMGRK